MPPSFSTPPEAINALRTLDQPLRDDVQHALQDASATAEGGDDERTQRARRNAVRALFSRIEGAVYGMKQLAYSVDQNFMEWLAYSGEQNVDAFNAEEVAILKEEEEYRLTDGSKAKVRHLSAPRTVRFAFAALTRVCQSDFVFKTDGKGWSGYHKARVLRDRLIHPKSVESLRVTDKEMKDVVQASAWFEETFYLALHQANAAAVRRYTRRMMESSDPAHGG